MSEPIRVGRRKFLAGSAALASLPLISQSSSVLGTSEPGTSESAATAVSVGYLAGSDRYADLSELIEQPAAHPPGDDAPDAAAAVAPLPRRVLTTDRVRQGDVADALVSVLPGAWPDRARIDSFSVDVLHANELAVFGANIASPVELRSSSPSTHRIDLGRGPSIRLAVTAGGAPPARWSRRLAALTTGTASEPGSRTPPALATVELPRRRGVYVVAATHRPNWDRIRFEGGAVRSSRTHDVLAGSGGGSVPFPYVVVVIDRA